MDFWEGFLVDFWEATSFLDFSEPTSFLGFCEAAESGAACLGLVNAGFSGVGFGVLSKRLPRG